jgi:hypothetical protein
MNAKYLALAGMILTASAANAAKLPTTLVRTMPVQNIQGSETHPLEASGRAATVLIFIAHDCPICNAYSAEIARLRDDYGPSHIALYVVYTDVGTSRAVLATHAKTHNYTSFALYDPKHILVKDTGAMVTPEAVVLGPHDRIRYEGRIDNRFTGFGLERDVASVSDLRRALDSIRLGKTVAVARTKAVGCYIPGV